MKVRDKATFRNLKKNRSNPVFKKQKKGISKSSSSPIYNIISLQKSIGNSAVQRLFESGAIQAKLKIGRPGDKYEQEADRVANQVMSMPEPHLQRQIEPEEEEEHLQTTPIAKQITTMVQRQAEEEREEEEEIQTKMSNDEVIRSQEAEPDEEEEEVVQANKSNAKNPVDLGLESKIHFLRGGGKPLPESTRSYFEPRFGYDFGQVRVHRTREAAEMAQAVNAKAFTTGQNVVFGAGQYAPDTLAGKKLIAHELTHNLQQQTTTSISSTNSQQNPAIMRAEFPEESEASIKPLRLFKNIPSPVVMRKESWILATVYFGKDHFLLLEDNYKLVERLSEELRFIPGATVVIDGHASTEGSTKYNKELSKKRRLAVIAILRSKLKTESRIEFSGEPYGEKETAVDEDKQESKRALNRRVEITIRMPAPVFERKKPIDLSLPIKAPTLDESLKIFYELDKKGELEPYRQKISGEEVLDKFLENVLKVPDKYRGIVKKGVKAVGEKALYSFLDETDLNKNEKKAIKKLIEGLYKYQFEF